MGFVRKLQLSSFQRPPLSFSTMFEACTIGSRMQCGIFQPDCKNLQKKFYEVGSQVQDFNFTQFWTPWVGTIWIRLNWLGSFTLGLQPPAAPCVASIFWHVISDTVLGLNLNLDTFKARFIEFFGTFKVLKHTLDRLPRERNLNFEIF